MRLARYTYFKLLDLFWAIVPFKIYSEDVPLYEVDQQYQPELDALSAQESQLESFKYLLNQINSLITQTIINAYCAKLSLEQPELVKAFNQTPSDDALASQINKYLQDESYFKENKANELGIAILSLIYTTFPELKEIGSKFDQGNISTKAGAGPDE